MIWITRTINLTCFGLVMAGAIHRFGALDGAAVTAGLWLLMPIPSPPESYDGDDDNDGDPK